MTVRQVASAQPAHGVHESALTSTRLRPPVQVQKLKLDTESAMLEMDQVSSAAASVQLQSFMLMPERVAPGTPAAMLMLYNSAG
jgi:hypothetical protein